jgi:hypothetical protein
MNWRRSLTNRIWNVTYRLKHNKWLDWTSYKLFSDLWWVWRSPFVKLQTQRKFEAQRSPFAYSSERYGRLLEVNIIGVGWKDKFDTPRFEHNPYFEIVLLRRIRYKIVWYPAGIDGFHQDDYWEQWLWWHYYADVKNQRSWTAIISARSTWPWTTEKDGKMVSTWSEECLLEKYRIPEL